MSFCKIHESSKYGTILVMRGFEPDENSYIVSLTISYNSCLVKAAINAKNESIMNEMYESMDLNRSENVYKSLNL